MRYEISFYSLQVHVRQVSLYLYYVMIMRQTGRQTEHAYFTELPFSQTPYKLM